MNMKRQSRILLPLLLCLSACGSKEDIQSRYIAAEGCHSPLYSYNKDSRELSLADSLVRGGRENIAINKAIKIDDTKYYPIRNKKYKNLYISEKNITTDSSALVLESRLWARSAASLISDTLSSSISGLLKRGDEAKITGYDRILPDGSVKRYLVSTSKSKGYVYGKYLCASKEEALTNYKAEVYDPLHAKVKNRFGSGKASDCDFYPYPKPKFKNNPMPEACYSLYINFSPSNIGNIENYIALAKQSKINTFVIDIKDNECPGFKADAMRRHSPTNYAKASSKGENLYRKAVQRLHEEGFYVVGRITCFKDSYFVKDHPESAITDKESGLPFKHNKSYWPSAYDRKVWQFNVELAKEAVEKFGFNEINFDYVRFPDRMTSIEDKINYHNRYSESKIQAIQRFVAYACDEIHEKGAYVSIDVFGECANPGYTTAYGQYWPALSNVADVMCGMPYPDHFPDGFYGISKPWNHPYELLYQWGLRVQERQKATANPAAVRTWVQAYHVMKHVDPNGIDYDAPNIEKEIRGLYAADLTGGYITWLSSSNINRYREQLPAFCIDYLAEYRKAQKP